jgi:hypothetical protein
LEALAGDRITIDWEGNAEILDFFPVGTTDFNAAKAKLEAQGRIGSNGKQQTAFTPSATGTRPITFWTTVGGICPGRGNVDPGPFAFTAFVKHAVRLSVPRRSSLPRRGTIRVRVQNPDGRPINDAGLAVALRIRSGGKVRTIGKARVAGGTAAIAYSAPTSLRGRKVVLTARATGANYLSKSSTSQTVKFR